VIKFVSDLRQVGGFHPALWLPPPNSDSSNTVLAQNGVSISTFYSLNTLLSFVYLYIAVGDPVIKRERVGMPLTGLIPFLCLSQTMTWIVGM
jgi:hypothetical protein